MFAYKTFAYKTFAQKTFAQKTFALKTFALKTKKWILALACLALAAGACQAAGDSSPTPGEPAAIVLTPYWTPTSSRTPTASPAGARRTPTPTIPAPPTPTPRTYQVKKGDTMLGIAFQNGISLEELQAANPDVDPGFLSVGATLIIPVSGGTPTVIPSPTPLPVSLEEPRCYPAPDGLWCLAPARNDQPQAVENLSAWLRVYSAEGEPLDGKEAIPPLNLLPPGRTLPLVAFFPGLEITDQTGPLEAEAELLTAFGVPEGDERYLEAQVLSVQSAINEAGLQATVQGWLDLPPSSPPADLVWLVGVAYSAQGEIVGVRKWEAQTSLSPGASLPFEVTVYSLGPPIQRVDVLAEARRQFTPSTTPTP